MFGAYTVPRVATDLRCDAKLVTGCSVIPETTRPVPRVVYIGSSQGILSELQ